MKNMNENESNLNHPINPEDVSEVLSVWSIKDGTDRIICSQKIVTNPECLPSIIATIIVSSLQIYKANKIIDNIEQFEAGLLPKITEALLSAKQK